jgi:hypothetical protein
MALKLIKQSTPESGEKWVDFDEDTRILLVGIDDKKYQIASERARRSLRRNDLRFEEGTVGVVAGEKSESELFARLLGTFIVRGWQGVLGESGEPEEFSIDSAVRLLEGSDEFFLFVLKKSGEIARDARAEIEETVGKPSPDSPGSASGAGKRTKSARSTNA